MTPSRLGMAQIQVEGGKPEANLNRAVAAIQRAADMGCGVVVLPECLDLGWTHPSAREFAQPIPGPHVDRLAAVARNVNMFVAAGLVERDGAKLYNSAVLIGPKGDLLIQHRKINELDIAHDLYSIGNRLGVVETELGTLCLAICADNFSDSLAVSHVLCRMGAQVILSPSAWAVDADHENERQPYGKLWLDAYSELARLYDVTVIGVSNVGWLTDGPWKGRKCIGCSLAVDPTGVLARGPYGESAEDVICVDILPRAPIARGTRVAEALRKRGYIGP